MLTTFNRLQPGEAFRFPGGSTVFVKIDQWHMKLWENDQIKTLWGECGHPPRDSVISEPEFNTKKED